MPTATKLIQTLETRFGSGGYVRTFFCPGRVNLIGEHIDYNGGFVFPATISMGIMAATRLRTDEQFRVYSLNLETEATFVVEANSTKDDSIGWANYVRGVLIYLKAKGHTLPGLDIVFEGDLPDGAGLSSSAALEVLTGYLALRMAGVEDADIDRTELALLCQAVENRFIGVNCGIMDQFSVANGLARHAMMLDCQKITARQVPLELGQNDLVIMNTNKERQLSESKYNERRAECEAALTLINRHRNYPDLCSAHQHDVDEFVKDPTLHRRATHVVSEQGRVLAAVDVLEEGNLVAFGELLNASHHSLKNDYEVSGTELDALVEAAQSQPGCLGARMTGAGFGGCALAIVDKEKVEEFKQNVARQYQQATGRQAEFYQSKPGPGVHELEQ